MQIAEPHRDSNVFNTAARCHFFKPLAILFSACRLRGCCAADMSNGTARARYRLRRRAARRPPGRNTASAGANDEQRSRRARTPRGRRGGARRIPRTEDGRGRRFAICGQSLHWAAWWSNSIVRAGPGNRRPSGHTSGPKGWRCGGQADRLKLRLRVAAQQSAPPQSLPRRLRERPRRGRVRIPSNRLGCPREERAAASEG